MKTVHRFKSSQDVENKWAPVLDRWLRETYPEVREATMDEQWRGIDRVVTTEYGFVTLDYKCDEKAQFTRNLFIEVMSNKATGRPGWAYAAEAEFLAYFVAPNDLWLFRLAHLRSRLPHWREKYPEREAINERDGKEYTTVGTCVPMPIAERAVEYIASLSSGDGIYFVRDRAV